MKEIYSIECPISGMVRFISKSPYPQIPPKIRQHPDYIEWERLLNKSGQKPNFKILDRVNESDLEKKFIRYLNEFQMKGIPLFNFTPPKDLMSFNIYSNQGNEEGSF